MNKSVLSNSISILSNFGTVCVPTDTCYGLASDATSDSAVRHLFSIKNRPLDKPIHVFVSDLEMAKEYVEVNAYAEVLASKFLPGPLTLVLPVLKNGKKVSKYILGEGNTLGIRIPNNEIVLELVKEYGKPLTATSANVSDQPNTYSIPQVQAQFKSQSLKPEFYIDAGYIPQRPPSTVIRIKGNSFDLIRAGSITTEELFQL